MYHRSVFGRFAKRAAHFVGHPIAFGLAVLIVLGWAMTGPFFGFSDTWQLVINTSTTIVTFLMVFLIQNTQNRDSAAMQVKLDELIRAIRGAHNALLDLEELDEQDLERLRAVYEALARRARADLTRGLGVDRTPEARGDETDLGSAGLHEMDQASSLVLFDQHGQVIWSAAVGAQRGGAAP
jgi:low affinity Fe/Cu permease